MFESFVIDTSKFVGGFPAVQTRVKSDQSNLIIPGRNTVNLGRLAPGHARFRPEKVHGEGGRWNVVAIKSHWAEQCIDWYRDKYGKEAGEFRFYAEHPEPDTVDIIPGNMVMGNGVAALWQCALGNGTSTANTALPTPTFYSNANTYLYVGDGGITTGTGTITLTGSSTSVTFGTAQSTLQGKYIYIGSVQTNGDTTNGLYIDTTASGTSHTLATAYGGPSTSGGNPANWYYLTAESHSQTALSGSSNVYGQAADSGFPTNPTTAQYNAVLGTSTSGQATLTVSGADINTNDIVQVFEVNGDTNTNGIWVANPATSSLITLLNGTSNAAWTYGGIVTKRTVVTAQATYGSSSGNFMWMEWALVNGSSTNKILLNRKVTSLGTKSGGTTALKVGIGIG